jgi:hypothetical protein
MLTVVSGSTIRFYDVKSGRTYGQEDKEGRLEDNKLGEEGREREKNNDKII